MTTVLAPFFEEHRHDLGRINEKVIMLSEQLSSIPNHLKESTTVIINEQANSVSQVKEELHTIKTQLDVLQGHLRGTGPINTGNGIRHDGGNTEENKDGGPTGRPATKKIEETINAVKDKPEDNQVKMSTLFYIHGPKTGTSFLTLLRNYIPSCPVKDFTCVRDGELGGGLPARMAKDGQNHFPHSAQSLNLTGTTDREMKSIEDCNGALQNCDRRYYHCEYHHCRDRKNKVTLFREPHKWFNSYLKWQWAYIATTGGPASSVENMLPFTPQIKFTTATTNVDQALETLQTDYVFWGITDYWSTTVCLFHCEVGGEFRDSELGNVRSLGSIPIKNVEDIVTTARKPDELVPNRTAYVLENYHQDLELYGSKLLPIFRDRAAKCNCAM